MTFQQLRTATEGPSPAAKLHQSYNRVAETNSRTDDWKKVLAAGVSFEQAEAIIRWLQHGGLPEFPSSGTIARNAKWYAELAARDPVASRVLVMIDAFELAVDIAKQGHEIEAEYVQDAINQYRGYLNSIDTSDMLYIHMLPSRIFVKQWFTEMMPHGTPRMRRFHLEHSKFKEFVRLTAKASRRG